VLHFSGRKSIIPEKIGDFVAGQETRAGERKEREKNDFSLLLMESPSRDPSLCNYPDENERKLFRCRK
jgi:hypothetical protein